MIFFDLLGRDEKRTNMSICHELFKASKIRGFIARLPDDDARISIIRFLEAYNGVYGDMSVTVKRVINKVICRMLTEATTIDVEGDKKRQERIVAFINLVADHTPPRPRYDPIINLHTIIRAIRVNAVLVAKRLIAIRGHTTRDKISQFIAANGSPAAFDTLRRVTHVTIEYFIVDAMQNCNIPVLKRIHEVYGDDAMRLFVARNCKSMHNILWGYRDVGVGNRVAMIDYFATITDEMKWDRGLLWGSILTNSLDVYDEFAVRRIHVNEPVMKVNVHGDTTQVSHFLGLIRRDMLGRATGKMSISRLINRGKRIGVNMGWLHELSCRPKDRVNSHEIVAAYAYHIRVRGISRSRGKQLADVVIITDA